MGLKEFLKPNKIKIIIFVVIFVLIFIIYRNINLLFLLFLLFLCYLLSCLIVWVWNRFRGKKKVQIPYFEKY